MHLPVIERLFFRPNDSDIVYHYAAGAQRHVFVLLIIGSWLQALLRLVDLRRLCCQATLSLFLRREPIEGINATQRLFDSNTLPSLMYHFDQRGAAET